MKRLGDENGQSLIMAALSMSILLGSAGFATDVGVMLHNKRLAQSAADSAAIAGAQNLHYGATAVNSAALNDAALNGFNNGSNGVTVTVTNPPSASSVQNASFATKDYVQVTISETNPAFFMSLFGQKYSTVSASAVASDGAPSQNCFYVVNPKAPNAMTLQGSFDVSNPGCDVIVDSTSPSALSFVGGSGKLTAGGVGVVGGTSGQTSDSTPTPVVGVVPSSDPLAWETPPVATGCTTPANGTLTGSVSPGCYSGNVTLSNATLGNGTYVFTGNLSFSGSVTNVPSGGAGVTIYLTSGNLSATTNSTLNLTAPTDSSFPYYGLLIWDGAPANSTNPPTIEIEMGNATGSLTGIIYGPNSELYVHDSGGDRNGGNGTGSVTLKTDIVVGTFLDQTGDLTVASYTQTAGYGSSPLTHPVLVE